MPSFRYLAVQTKAGIVQSRMLLQFPLGIFCELFSAASRIRKSKPMDEESNDSLNANSDKPQSDAIPWGRIYISVLIFTVIVIVSLYFFSQLYSD